MKYLLIDSAAIDEIVSSRTLQSTEFEGGKSFASVLIGQAKTAILSPTMSMFVEGDGLAILGGNLRKIRNS